MFEANVVPFEFGKPEASSYLPASLERGISFDRKTLLQAALADPLDQPHLKRFSSTSSKIIAFDLFVHIQQ